MFLYIIWWWVHRFKFFKRFERKYNEYTLLKFEQLKTDNSTAVRIRKFEKCADSKKIKHFEKSMVFSLKLKKSLSEDCKISAITLYYQVIPYNWATIVVFSMA